jgi:acyl-CoA thioester hydrolase
MLAEPLSVMHINLNNGTYFRYLETARIDWMRSIGFEPVPGGEGVVIVNAFCNFYRQIEYPGNVLLKMYVSDPGAKPPGADVQAGRSTMRASKPRAAPAGGDASSSLAFCFSTMVATIERPSP